MAFGDRIHKFGKALGKIDPFMGRLLGGDSEDRKKFAPQAQFYGGSEEQSRLSRNRMIEGSRGGTAQIASATQRANDAADYAGSELGSRSNRAETLGKQAQAGSVVAGQGFDRSVGDYRAGRSAVLGNAGTLEKMAADAPGTYQATAEKAFNNNQGRNTRAALATAAGHGAAGLRTALATSSQANADAAGQAEVTRAQEFNDLQQQRQNAVVNAAGIRSGVGTQDQNAATIYSGRQQQYDANAAQGNRDAANTDLARANVQQNAAQLGGQLGLGTQGQFLNAEGNLETAQLQANQKSEDQRQLSERQNYNKKWFPIMSSFNQA